MLNQIANVHCMKTILPVGTINPISSTYPKSASDYRKANVEGRNFGFQLFFGEWHDLKWRGCFKENRWISLVHQWANKLIDEQISIQKFSV